MALDIVNPAVVEQLDQFASQFKQAEPFGHVIIDDFLRPDVCQALLDQFPSFDERLAMNESGEVGRKAVNEKVAQLGAAYQQVDALAKSSDFRAWVGQITGIPELLYDPHYFGGGSHENLSGQSLDSHVDFTHHPITGWHRRLNLIVYLNPDWRREWGGNIEFHKNPRLPPEQDRVVEVVPLFNRAVLFETHNHSWHGFKAVNLPDSESDRSRKSFALYFYTDDRAKKVRPHSTIYVEEHLAEDVFAAGKTLSESDSQLIRTHLTRRDHHLHRLYNNISDLMAQLQEAKVFIEHIKQVEKELNSVTALEGEDVETLEELTDDDSALYHKLVAATLRERLLRKRLLEIENATLWKISAPIRALINRIRGH